MLINSALVVLLVCALPATRALVQLDDDNYEKIVRGDHENDNKLWIIDFYAPWCEHCKLLEPELEKLEQQLEENNLHDVKIAKVDGTEATTVAFEHSVKHYPTIFFLQSGKYHTYSGMRTAESLLEFAQRIKKEITVVTIENEGELQPYFDRNELVFLLTYPVEDTSVNRPDIEEQFRQVAVDLKLSCTFAMLMSSSNNDRIATLKKMESNRTSLVMEIDKDTTPLDIVDFTERHNHMLLTPLDKTNFRRLGRTGKPLVIAIVNPFRDEDGSQAMVDAMEEAVSFVEEADHIDTETIHNHIFGHMDGLKYRMFLSRYRATPPSILVIDLSTDHTPGELGGGGYYVEYDVSPESIRNVVEKTILRELLFKEILSLDLTFFGRIKKKIDDYFPWSLLCLFPLFMMMITLLVPKPDDKWKRD